MPRPFLLPYHHHLRFLSPASLPPALLPSSLLPSPPLPTPLLRGLPSAPPAQPIPPPGQPPQAPPVTTPRYADFPLISVYPLVLLVPFIIPILNRRHLTIHPRHPYAPHSPPPVYGYVYTQPGPDWGT
ncbi:hypothetical protein BDQ17DRAFT_1423025 [Cyathus striatus]|nr:hypothetical protein BDQ17DRAFT_1423025 [Cyathus striatus]